MNREQLTDAIAIKLGVSKKAAKLSLDAVVESMTEALVAGDEVKIIDFGKLELRKRKQRVARNIGTGEDIQIEAHNTVVFVPGKALKGLVNA